MTNSDNHQTYIVYKIKNHCLQHHLEYYYDVYARRLEV